MDGKQIPNFIDKIQYNLILLSNNKYFIGLMMVLLNLGSRYIYMEMGRAHDIFFNQKWVRRMLIFTVFFIATRDILASLLMTVAFIVFFLELTHENSKYCILPKKNLVKIKVDDMGYATKEEITRVYKDLDNKKPH
jgi:hypothetical protein